MSTKAEIAELDRRQIISGIVALCLGSPALAASDDQVILTISGLGEKIEYTLDDLKAMESSSFSTSTIWSDGVMTFTGVPLHTLLARLGVTDGRLLLKAINDYAVEVPVSDGIEGGPILAYLLDGKEMSIRDKGPLWLIYPYDQNPDYRSEVIYSRSIWQLDRIEVLP